MEVPFYDEYFKLQIHFSDTKANEFKDKYIRTQLLVDNHIYKYISFVADKEKNLKKLKSITDEAIWLSSYTQFDDKNEVKIIFDPNVISKNTNRKKENIKNFVKLSKELNDISCFTNSNNDYMWMNYANNYNGVCLKFKMDNSDLFFPIIYMDKEKINLTDDYIKAFNNRENSIKDITRLSILPWVLKDKQFYDENEIRLLCGDVYDEESGPLGGRIFPGKKQAIGYLGISFDYKKCGLVLVEVTIGDNCDIEIRDKLLKYKKERNL